MDASTVLEDDMLRPMATDDNVTDSSEEQAKVEAAVRSLYEEWKENLTDYTLDTELTKEEHLLYLMRGLQQLPGGYSSLDASRPWLAYWILHSFELLRVFSQLPEQLIDRSIDFLGRCQNATGGFGGGPGQAAHLAPTYAATNALCILASRNKRAYDVIDRTKLYSFLMRCKQPNGPFAVCAGGEIDTRGTYTALAVASICNVLTDELTAGSAEWLASCQTYEGGIGGEPGNEAHGGYAFCGLAALTILQRTDLIDLDAMLKWAVNRQMSFEGGFQGRTNKLVDGCYSFWVGGLFPILDFLIKKKKKQEGKNEDEEKERESTGWLFDQWSLQKYVLVCCQGTGFKKNSGGLRDKPGLTKSGYVVRPDYYHTCYCLSGLSVAQNSLNEAKSPVLGKTFNKLNPTNAIYNVGADIIPVAIKYFSELPKPTENLVQEVQVEEVEQKGEGEKGVENTN